MWVVFLCKNCQSFLKHLSQCTFVAPALPVSTPTCFPCFAPHLAPLPSLSASTWNTQAKPSPRPPWPSACNRIQVTSYECSYRDQKSVSFFAWLCSLRNSVLFSGEDNQAWCPLPCWQLRPSPGSFGACPRAITASHWSWCDSRQALGSSGIHTWCGTPPLPWQALVPLFRREQLL